jgi:hypothetical protein
MMDDIMDKDATVGHVPGEACGGVLPGEEVEVNKYRPPVGPKGIGDRGPGLHGTNHGSNVDQGKH